MAKLKQIEIKEVRIKKGRLLIHFRRRWWFVYKRPSVKVTATITKPTGKVIERESWWWPPWRGGYVGNSFSTRGKQNKGIYHVEVKVQAKKAHGCQGVFDIQVGKLDT